MNSQKPPPRSTTETKAFGPPGFRKMIRWKSFTPGNQPTRHRLSIAVRPGDAWFLALAVVIVGLDQFTKWGIRHTLSRGDVWPGDWPVHIVHITNTGAAFGILQHAGPLLVVTSLIGMAAILIYLFNPGFAHPLMRAGLALMLGGAVGNLIDRLVSGEVVDFIKFPHWPGVQRGRFGHHDWCVPPPMGNDTRNAPRPAAENSAPRSSGRIDAVLASAYPDLSRARLQRLIAAGNVTINGEPVRKSGQVQPTATSSRLDVPETPHDGGPGRTSTSPCCSRTTGCCDRQAAGPAPSTARRATRSPGVALWMLERLGSAAGSFDVERPGIVHRLDQDTSGVLLLAKTPLHRRR